MLNTAPQIQYSAILDFVYPIGSYFITESPNYDTVAKVQAHFGGTWAQIDAGRFLESSTSTAGTPKDAGLPDIQGSMTRILTYPSGTKTGCFTDATYGGTNKNATTNGGYWTDQNSKLDFKASKSNSIYGSSTTVQPKSRTVYMYRRTA